MAQVNLAPSRAVFFAISFASLLGLAAGCVHLYLRFVNNTQGEMYNARGIDVPYAVLLFAAAFIPVWLIAFSVGVAIILVFRRMLYR